jgi:hypothetical protein
MRWRSCADTESAAYDRASAAFEEASSQLEELGFEYEITPDGVSFSRSGTAVEEYGPATRIGAAPFLELSGTAEPGSLDQVIDVSDYKGLLRCPVLVCPKSKVKFCAKSTYYKFCANPSTFQVNGWHFCGGCTHRLASLPRTIPALLRRAGYLIVKRTCSSVVGCMGWASHTLCKTRM